MSGVSFNLSVKGGAKPAGYDTSKAVNISDQLKKADAGKYDVSTFTPVTSNYYGMKVKASPSYMAMRSETEMGQASQALIADVKSAVGSYFDGELSLEELQTEYKTLVERHVGTVTENSLLPGTQLKQCAAEAVHDLFRETVLDTAVQRNNAEGRQYVSDGFNSQDRAYQYYNADYYYQSEEVLAALTESAKDYGVENGFEFGSLDTAPKLSVVGDNRYDNFNTAWSTGVSGSSTNYIIDTDKAPPENFKWFYEGPNLSGKDGEGKITLLSVTTELPNGEKVTEYFHQAFTWASWSEDTENLDQYHRISAEVPYGWSQEKLENVAALIKFSTSNPEVDSILNGFLKNLQIYPKANFGGLNIYA